MSYDLIESGRSNYNPSGSNSISGSYDRPFSILPGGSYDMPRSYVPSFKDIVSNGVTH